MTTISDTAPQRRVSFTALRAYTMFFALVVIWMFFQYKTVSDLYPYGLFLHPLNFANLLKQMSVTGVLAVGMLMVIVARQIDLSIGSLLGLAGGVAAMAQELGLVPSLFAAIVIGLAVGALQGSLVAWGNIPAFIVTLGGLLTWRGVILYLSKGETIPIRLPVFRSIGVSLVHPAVGLALAAVAIAAIVWVTLRRNATRRRHGLAPSSAAATLARIVLPSALAVLFVYHMNLQGGVPLPVLVLLVVALLGAFVTRSTTFGRYLYAIGSNPEAARLSGISIGRHILGAFCFLGAMVGVAAILHTGRVGSSSPDAGSLMELDAIAACVIGGTSLMGGRGTVAGALLGALIMASLDNGMSLLSVENATQYIIKGAVLVAAVGFDMAGRRKG
ncbi:MAG TPA: sugar ABC transporter permease [Thermoanaerobaculia bacterium]|nr:sugar ABC transporter permease [Thermoanaerobaculia bacterium]